MKRIILMIGIFSILSFNSNARTTWWGSACTDAAAGLATLATGPLCYLIGGLASTAYCSQGMIIHPQTGNGGENNSNPMEQAGRDHNKFCKLYIESGVKGIDVDLAKKIAIQVRPDLSIQINALDNNAILDQVNSILNTNLETKDGFLNFIKNSITLNSSDEATLNDLLNEIFTSSIDERVNNVILLENRIKDFNINSEDKNKLYRTFSIFRESTYFWNIN